LPHHRFMPGNSRVSRGTAAYHVHGARPGLIGLPHVPTVVCVGLPITDHALRQCFSRIGCRIVSADTCTRARRLLHRSDISVVICAANLPDGNWRNVLHSAAQSPREPAFIVTSPCADEYLWAEVLNLGGFDVIAQPFDPEELYYVLTSACLRRLASDLVR
jgi:DNA-binding response OmpR family regulator